MYQSIVNCEKNRCRWLAERICRASSELLFSHDFLDRYNRYTKRQATFPKEQESRNEFLSVLNYNPLSHTVYRVTSKLPGTWRRTAQQKAITKKWQWCWSRICNLSSSSSRCDWYSAQKIILNRFMPFYIPEFSYLNTYDPRSSSTFKQHSFRFTLEFKLHIIVLYMWL